MPRRFLPEVQGLRAVAVLLVLVYHLNAAVLPGGYVGVDVFFVISGFLITGLLWREAANTGTVRLARFYAARARRLLPAAATVLTATVVLSVLLLPPLQARSVIGDGIAAALYVGNYRFAIEGTDYLSTTEPSPLQHYWSLGVEEQFYLVWPALILATVWLLGRTTRLAGVAAMRSATPYLVALTAVGAVSFGVSLTLTESSPSWAFFGLPSRAWELAVGGLVALTIPWWRRLPAVSAAVVGWGGLALIALTCTQVDEATPYPGTAALLPVFGTALVIIAGCATPDLGAGRFLSTPVMRSIGRVSYSWYLWHWPVLILAPALFGRDIGLAGNLAMVLVSLGLAIMTLHLVENPARFAEALRSSTVRSLAVGAVATATAVCAALVLLAIRPVPVGAGEAAAPAAISAPVPEPRPLTPREQIRAAVAASTQPRPVPANLKPSLAQAPNAKPEMFVNGCVRSWRDVDQPECASGDVRSPVRVALFGDSHAAMWESALNPVAQQRHWRLETMGKVTCPPQELPIFSPYLGRTFTECGRWRTQVLSRLRQNPPQLVIVDMVRRYGADFGFTSYDEAWLRGLTELVSTLRGLGSQVLVLGPVPDPHGTVPNCLSDNMDDVLACSPTRRVGINGEGVAAEAAATTAAGGVYADLSELFCTDRRCPVVIGDTLVFRDDNHITSEYAAVLAPVLAELVDQTLARS